MKIGDPRMLGTRIMRKKKRENYANTIGRRDDRIKVAIHIPHDIFIFFLLSLFYISTTTRHTLENRRFLEANSNEKFCGTIRETLCECAARHHLWSRIYIILRVFVFQYMLRVMCLYVVPCVCACVHVRVSCTTILLCLLSLSLFFSLSFSLSLSFSPPVSLFFTHTTYTHSHTHTHTHFLPFV